MPDYVPQPDDPINDTPVLFRPTTFARHERAVRDIEGANQARYPMEGRGRTTRPARGWWGQLQSGDTISACSGLTLGSGNVTLCSRNDINLNPDGDVVKVYNAGGTITGPQTLELDWTDGDWAVCVCGGSRVCVVCGTTVIPGATVSVQDDSTILDSGTTGDDGCLPVTVPVGTHTVVVTATGYDTSTTTHVFTGSDTYTVDLCGGCGGCVLPSSDLHINTAGGSRPLTYHSTTFNGYAPPTWTGSMATPLGFSACTLYCGPGVDAAGWTLDYFDEFANFSSVGLAGTCDPVNLSGTAILYEGTTVPFTVTV